ncbi:MAG TPA: hypothetical protein GX004_05310 [Firmicutes bacterium]|nr:hypothetical protein [Bacillota bacterium]
MARAVARRQKVIIKELKKDEKREEKGKRKRKRNTGHCILLLLFLYKIDLETLDKGIKLNYNITNLVRY